MADKKEDDYRGDGVNPKFIHNTTGIRLDGSLDVGSSLFADGRIHGAQFPLTFTTEQSAVMRTGAILGEHLLGMHINTVGDARNFLIGVNNMASQVTMNPSLLGAIQATSTVAMEQGRLIRQATDSLIAVTGGTGVHLDASRNLYINETLRLSESVTTVLAYGQAVQQQIGSFVSQGEILKNGMIAARDAVLGTTYALPRTPVYVNPETITSPFVYAPQKVKPKEVEKVLPEVKKELPAKTTEAIDLMEHIFNVDTKNDDKIITTTVAELKRAIKNMQGSVMMFMQQTTHKVEVVSLPTVQTVIEKSTSHANKFPFKIPAGTMWQNITIQFTNSDMVAIQVAGHSHQTGYADMGFVDGRTNKPTVQWGLLLVLAKNNGFLSASSSDARDKYKKHKQLLADKLKGYFSIEPDPFEPYKGGYKTRITLIPHPTEQNEQPDDYSTTNEIDEIFRDFVEE
jgi:hypothetical protein